MRCDIIRGAISAAWRGSSSDGNVTYVAAFYILDITMITIDLVLTIRNKRLDRAAEKEETV